MSSSRADVNVSHMRRPDTTDHSAQLPPPPKEAPPPLSLRETGFGGGWGERGAGGCARRVRWGSLRDRV